IMIDIHAAERRLQSHTTLAHFTGELRGPHRGVIPPKLHDHLAWNKVLRCCEARKAQQSQHSKYKPNNDQRVPLTLTHRLKVWGTGDLRRHSHLFSG